VATRRITVAVESDDLAVLDAEARRRGVALAQVLREAVEREAGRLRDQALPRFGVLRGDGNATPALAADERAPARRRGRS
jgi:Ribbon-helix-helix protein, copG family